MIIARQIVLNLKIHPNVCNMYNPVNIQIVARLACVSTPLGDIVQSFIFIKMNPFSELDSAKQISLFSKMTEILK